MIQVPDGVQVQVDGGTVTVKGSKGTLQKRFPSGVRIERTGNAIAVSASGRKRGDKAAAGTVEAHIRNMVEGASNGYSVKMQCVYSHFPMSIEVRAKQITIKNFLGEKQPRVASVVGETKVEPKGQDVTVSGASKEDVGQTVANIITATHIRGRDSRVFQDGVYVVKK
jgi:large subunit ribosomal protein L6